MQTQFHHSNASVESTAADTAISVSGTAGPHVTGRRASSDAVLHAATESGLSRRAFLLSTAAAATAMAAGCAAPQPHGAPAVHGERRPEQIRVGLIGCGGRGTGAAIDCANADPGVRIVALGDLFPDRLAEARKNLAQTLGERADITDERCFTGFSAYQGVLLAGVDMVILATPPGFRPIHLKAAIEGGRHVFMEKPVAVDPVGVRSVIASSELAAARGLAIVCGTQRRHDPVYVETMRRVHGGAIGRIVAAECYWNQEGLWVKPREAGWSDMEWQVRNWLYFTWLSGDHIVEQHVHNIDVINWALNAHPVKAMGMGGREVRKGPEYGQIFDHFAIEYEYPGGVRVLSMCRQIDKTATRIGERLIGEKGTCDPHGEIMSKKPFKFEYKGDAVNPYVQEHADLIASIRSGKPLNEGRRIAESTMTAILGRMSAYTGREISWEWAMNASQLDLSPAKYEFGDLAVAPVAVPGQTPLV